MIDKTVHLTTALNAVVATTTSEAQFCKGATRITLYLTRANHSSGSSQFSVTVSGDDSTYIDYNKLIDNVTNTNAQNLTRVANVTLSSNTTVMLTLDLQHDIISSFKVKVTETTDGTHTAKCLIEY